MQTGRTYTMHQGRDLSWKEANRDANWKDIHYASGARLKLEGGKQRCKLEGHTLCIRGVT